MRTRGLGGRRQPAVDAVEVSPSQALAHEFLPGHRHLGAAVLRSAWEDAIRLRPMFGHGQRKGAKFNKAREEERAFQHALRVSLEARQFLSQPSEMLTLWCSACGASEKKVLERGQALLRRRLPRTLDGFRAWQWRDASTRAERIRRAIRRAAQ